MHSLWMPNQDLDATWGVTLRLMRDIAPADAPDGMLTAQLSAAHAPATTSGTVADEPPMRSAHPEANALQIATGSGKDPLPDARRGDGERSADREQECPEAWPLHGGSDSLEAEVSSADAPEPTIDREPVSVADEPVAALVDDDNLPEW